MSDQFTGNDLLDWINREVCIENGELVRRSALERQGQQLLDVTDQQRFELKQPIDLVIQGYCSTGIRHLEFYGNEEFPMGRLLQEEGKPERSWLHYIIEERKPKNVLVYSDCCGQYDEKFQALLKRTFPEVNWMFPDIGDLFDNVPLNIDRLAYHLWCAKVIGPA